MKHIALLLALPLLWTGADWKADSRPDFARLDRDGQPFRDAFNVGVGKIRIVAYVAPTCGGCLRGVDQLQEALLDQINAPDLELHVVWVMKNGARERHVARVTRLAPDPRATHYWDAERFVLRALDSRLGLEGRACAGAFLLYDRSATWDAVTPPEPVYWSDAHAREFDQDGPQFDARRFAREVSTLLAR